MKQANNVEIGRIIKDIRKSNGDTQERLVEKIEVSVRYISDIEQDRAKPSYDILIRICNLYKIGMNQIFNKYLKVTENKTIEYKLAGYDKLDKKDKETIDNLIIYFNKK